VTECEG
jgi:hypothetical protein